MGLSASGTLTEGEVLLLDTVSIAERVAVGQFLVFPTHIKIDVDGAEDKVVAGGTRVFADDRVRSVMLELNSELPAHRAIEEQMRAWGFASRRARPSSLMNADFATVHNVFFERRLGRSS